VAEGSPRDLQESWLGNTILRVELKSDPEEAAEVLGALPGVIAVETRSGEGGGYRLECTKGADPRQAVFETAKQRDWILLELAREQASLEDIFVRLTTQEPTMSTAPNDVDGRSQDEVPS
jgi:ABC-2 type transport system ATP-binding protein